MDIRRSEPPKTIERGIDIEMSREEVQSILAMYVKKKLNTDQLRFDTLQVVGSSDGTLESITLSGAEIIPLTWNSPADVPPTTPPVPQPPTPVVPKAK